MSTNKKKTPWTTTKLRALKGKEKIVCLTAYDYSTARLVDEAGVHLIMVGDSLSMTMLGHESTIPVTMEDMIHHSRAVVRGVTRALVVTDMPFLSYQASVSQAVENAGRILKEGRADTVKLEGGAIRKETIEALVENGIPVMGHIGLTPQSVKEFGGYRVQGKRPRGADKLKADAKALEEAGCFSIVLEGIPAELAGEITDSIGIPTVGIGAGPRCDGQVLVIQDLLGMYNDLKPKFVKRYAELGDAITGAVEAYATDVRNGDFPGPEHCY
jgi:3-methyl-2-oxobutanoate hydroxymethyltransferase